MLIAAMVVSLLLALAMAASAFTKFARSKASMSMLRAVGVPDRIVPVLGLLEVAATVGLVVGMWIAPLAVAAATGATLYFGGAVVAHLRVHDKRFTAAMVLALMSLTAVVLHFLR